MRSRNRTEAQHLRGKGLRKQLVPLWIWKHANVHDSGEVAATDTFHGHRSVLTIRGKHGGYTAIRTRLKRLDAKELPTGNIAHGHWHIGPTDMIDCRYQRASLVARGRLAHTCDCCSGRRIISTNDYTART